MGYNCFRQHAGLDAFYTALRGRIRTKDWYVIDVGGNLGQEPNTCGHAPLPHIHIRAVPGECGELELQCSHEPHERVTRSSKARPARWGRCVSKRSPTLASAMPPPVSRWGRGLLPPPIADCSST